VRPAILAGVGAAITLAAIACGSGASPEKTGTETFGCYVGSCVEPGVGEGDDGDDDAGAPDASDAG
jgi:hypothetical protein